MVRYGGLVPIPASIMAEMPFLLVYQSVGQSNLVPWPGSRMPRPTPLPRLLPSPSHSKQSRANLYYLSAGATTSAGWHLVLQRTHILSSWQSTLGPHSSSGEHCSEAGGTAQEPSNHWHDDIAPFHRKCRSKTPKPQCGGADEGTLFLQLLFPVKFNKE
jgi:hypothetical protein